MLRLVRPRRGRGRGRVRARLRRVGRLLVAPVAQLVYAAAVALFGAWLIAVWVIGLLLIVFAALAAGDALLRDRHVSEQRPQNRHEEILERWRNAR